jgi:hypothetical protein
MAATVGKGDDVDPYRSDAWNVFAGAATFVVIGAPVGSLVLSLSGLLIAGTNDLAGIIGMLLAFAFGSLWVGAVPAAIAGAVVGYFRDRLVTRTRYLAAGVFASAVSTVCGMVFAITISRGDAVGKAFGVAVSVIYMWMLPGLVGGTVAAAVLGPWQDRVK